MAIGLPQIISSHDGRSTYKFICNDGSRWRTFTYAMSRQRKLFKMAEEVKKALEAIGKS